MAATAATDAPPVSHHAAQRWDQRTAPDSVAPETAWAHGQRINTDRTFRASEVRYHRPTGTLLLHKPPSIMTVLTVEDMTDRQYHAVKHALSQEARR